MRLVSRFALIAFCLLVAAPVLPAEKPDYRLAERDLIEVQVFNQPEMTVRQRVSASGELRLPLIGTVEVAGKTLRETELKLEDVYKSEGYFTDPQVILAVVEYGARFVSVLGEVENPVRIEFPPEETSISVIQAITEAGGFTRVARIDQVQVIRRSANREERIALDLERALSSRQPGAGANFQLQPGDVVFVPERVF